MYPFFDRYSCFGVLTQREKSTLLGNPDSTIAQISRFCQGDSFQSGDALGQLRQDEPGQRDHIQQNEQRWGLRPHKLSVFSAYDFTTGGDVDICIYKAGYVPYTIRSYTLPAADGSLPVAQQLDRNYTP